MMISNNGMTKHVNAMRQRQRNIHCSSGRRQHRKVAEVVFALASTRRPEACGINIVSRENDREGAEEAV